VHATNIGKKKRKKNLENGKVPMITVIERYNPQKKIKIKTKLENPGKR
jgi:hypothetical protein